MQGKPEMAVEDSIPLRGSVLALVILGIVATDIASESSFAFWAIPLSTVGSCWSYFRRRNSNVPVKFCIAIGMLVALGVFFGQLLGQLNDTRLVLAELLIQLQVLHSFDMPRRKDLGYSIVIGLILLGVAATLSQTLGFAPILLLFLATALPTLVLDYRSRLGIEKVEVESEKVKQKSNSSQIPFYFLLFTLIVGLGLGIFAVLPRFPGYQLRMFPMSAPIEVKENFTGRSITNPGYVRQGRGNNQGRVGSGGSTQDDKSGTPGKLDSTQYYGFNSTINQNLRGEMKPKVLMRVRSQAEAFWRVLAFDRYTGKGWEISRNEQVKRFKRSPWSYQIFLDQPLFSGKSKEIVQTYSIVADMPNLVPAMAHAKQVYFPAPMLAQDTEGGIRSPVELSSGLTYTVISDAPYRDRTLLGKAGTKYPKQIQDYYLKIPPQIAEKVKKRTEEIFADYKRVQVSRSEKELDSPYEKSLYLAQFLKQHYSLPKNPLDLPFIGEKDDLVETFLFKAKGGYPDHFSTVLTIMLRSVGIPARLVVGFSAGQFNPFTGLYVVSNTDAHAMTEVYFPKYGWFAFDPIPGHPLIPPSIEEDQTFSVLRQFWNWVAGWLPSPVTGLLNAIFETIFSIIARTLTWFWGLFSQGWLGVLTGLTVGTATAFMSWFAWVQLKEWRFQRRLSKLPPMESLYQQMLKWTAKKGLGKHPAQTPFEYAKTSYEHHVPGTAEAIDEICQAYVSWRYGGENPNLEELRQKWKETIRSSQFAVRN
jgi:transglutaminase-like putative cysteine protease